MGWIFSNLPNPSGRTMAPGVESASNIKEYQELKKKKKKKRNLGAKGRPARKADDLAAIC
jgi:hypothetical protein